MKVTLHATALASSADAEIFLPWLQAVALDAAQRRAPTAVVVPLRADAYALKARALAAGIGLFGVHFLTPGELRERLAQHLGSEMRAPLREHLRLLLATAAERMNERRSDEATASVAAAPDQLLKAIDLIGGGGWSFAEAGPARLRPVVAEFQRLLAASGFELVHDLDRALLQSARAAAPLFARLFITHFNAAHWPHWPLLEATVRVSAETAVCLTLPGAQAESLDAAWIGTWEQSFGEYRVWPEEPDAVSLAPDFLVGGNTLEQAQAIVARAAQYLADPQCSRLGVLFPAAGALSRLVAAQLAALDIPHHDGLAHQAPGPLEDATWTAWLALQENPRLATLLAFVRTRSDEPFGGVAVDDCEDALNSAFQTLLFDDLPTLAAYLATSTRRSSDPQVAETVRALPLLPIKATLGDYIRRSGEIFRGLGWMDRATELARLSADWEMSKRLSISRRSWLRWLSETLVSWRTTRAAEGRHPYSRLHLLPYAQAESQSWSHLILAGLNEGQWPPTLEDVGYIGEDEVDALNRQLASLNTRVSARGSQGEGHVAIQRGKTLCLGTAERRALVRRQFANILQSVSVGVTAATSLIDEAAPERPLNPSEFFNELHFTTRQRAASHDTLAALQAETRRWLERSGLFPTASFDRNSVAQTRLSFDARRESDTPFGPYQFTLREPPPAPLHLAATKWDQALSSPAQVWMEVLLGIYARSTETETPWSLATGNWTHRWLAAISAAAAGGDFAPLPSAAVARERARACAEAFRQQVEKLLTDSGRAMPDWWSSIWEQGWRITSQLLDRVAEVHDYAALATERRLSDSAIPLPTGGALHLRGRTDLLLASPLPAPGAVPERVWIIDYKTGAKDSLKTASIAQGKGLQLALYALAWQSLGATEVGASILTPAVALNGPQVTWPALSPLTGLWKGLLAMQERAHFGQLGALRDEWSFRGDYPLATLAIDPDLLEAKWALTHPEFAGEEEEAAS